MFLKTDKGYVKLKDDGTYVIYPVMFAAAGSTIIKRTLDPATGRELSAEIVQQKTLLMVDGVTGDIRSVQRGFVLDHELAPEEIATPDGCFALRVVEPPDFMYEAISKKGNRVTIVAYKVDITTRQLVHLDPPQPSNNQ